MQSPEVTKEITSIYAGRLDIGLEGASQIHPVEDDAAVAGIAEKGRDNIVAVENHNTATCIDGRCAVCTGQDAQGMTVEALKSADFAAVPIVAKVPGGAYHFATMMALGANAALLGGARSYNEAYERVASLLAAAEITDTRHSSTTSFTSPTGTECGAIDKAPEMVRLGTEEVGYGPISRAVGALYGGVVQDNYVGVCDNFKAHTIEQLFAGYDPVAMRDAINPAALELLDSDPDHPTHLHTEQMIGINEILGTTLDRDRNNGDMFWYDRWFARKLANLMSGTPEEQNLLLMAADYTTVLTAHRLVAPGMPVALYTSAT